MAHHPRKSPPKAQTHEREAVTSCPAGRGHAAMTQRKSSLGRGLADLLGASKARAAAPAAPVSITPPAAAPPTQAAVPAPQTAATGPRGDELAHLPVDSLTRGKYQ